MLCCSKSALTHRMPAHRRCTYRRTWRGTKPATPKSSCVWSRARRGRVPLCALPRRMYRKSSPQLRRGHTIFHVCRPVGSAVRFFQENVSSPIISLPSQWFPAPCATAGRIRICPGRRSCTKRGLLRPIPSNPVPERCRYRRRLNRARAG